MGSVWIVDRSHGQLGNRLFFLAAVYAWCLEDGHELRYPGLHRYAHHLPALDGQWFNSPTNPTRCPLSRGKRVWFQRRFVDVFRFLTRAKLVGGRVRPPGGAVACGLRPTRGDFPTPGRKRYVLFSWRFNNPVGLRKYRGRIVELLRPRPEVEADARAFVAKSFAGVDGGRPRLAVHIRRTDYKGFKGGAFYHDNARYMAEMDGVRRALGIEPVFVIFSDEPQKAEDFSGFDVRISGGGMMEDLTRMAKLDGAIGPVSTFSTLAMYLAGNTVFHFGPGAEVDGFEWVYEGLDVVRSAEAFAPRVREAVARRVGAAPSNA